MTNMPRDHGTLSRRGFLAATAAGMTTLSTEYLHAESTHSPRARNYPTSFDPWLEISPAALRENARTISRAAGGRPVLAVVKNNAYGLGLETVGPVLDAAEEVAGIAVVKAEEAITLRRAGVRKPILLMGLFDPEEGYELARLDVRLSPFTDDAGDLLTSISQRIGRAVPVHLYLDTGMSRLGMPYHRALPWLESLARNRSVMIEGAFMTFTEDQQFDPEQLGRFNALIKEAKARGISLGKFHACSSHSLFFRPDAYLDMVRPGLTVYGAYPGEVRDLSAIPLRPAFRLKARVVRVEQLRPGDSVSYGRTYVAERLTWIATLPVGHSDGYPRTAVKGCEVLIGDRLYPVIGAVSASHAIIEVGSDRTVSIGDEAILVGPDRDSVLPNTVARRAGVSVYDILMHLSPLLPKRLTA